MPDTLLDPAFLARLERLELVSRKVFLGRTKGDRLSKRKGRSSEFADFRPYAVGDDLRFLDWNLYARLERLFLRVFLEEEDLHFSILIDTSLSMGFGSPSKLRVAKQVAAALGFVGLTNLDRVVVRPFDEKLAAGTPPLRGRRSLRRLLDLLDGMNPAGGSDFTRSLRAYALQTSSRGVVVVVSDFLDKGGYEEGLRYLVARDLDVYALQILAREEVEPELMGDLRLTDAEDGDVAEVTVNAPLVERYKRTLAAFRAGLAEFCSKRNISYLFATNQVPFEKLVLEYFRRRGLVR